MPTLEEYQQSGAAQLKQGAALVAYDTLAAGLRQHPGDARLRQLLALALARTGASRQANHLLRRLVAEGHADEETVGMLARTYKDLAARASAPAARREYLEHAFRHYSQAHVHSGGYWSGINAATLALLLDRHDESRTLAERVRRDCLVLLQSAPAPGDRYWLLATLGEAALLTRETGAAEEWYAQATSLQGRSFGDLVTTRRNARLILRHLGADTARIDACFAVPRIGVFAGHLVDRPDRPVARFPPTLVPAMARALQERVRRAEIGIGYASAGCGGDLLFLETLAEREAETHIVLPYNQRQFIEDSVDLEPGGDWVARFHAAVARAAEVVTASEQRMLSGAMSYAYGFLLLDGMAAVRADELDADLVCFALWDGREGDGPGGTAASVAHWRQAGRQIEIIEVPPSPPIVVSTPAVAEAEAPAADAGVFEAQLAGLFFADVVGFSKLTEEQIPRFVEHYMGEVARIVAQSDEQPLFANTWGDGLYFVFRDVGATGRFALRLSESLRSIDWAARGLPATLGLRMAVHAGPVYVCLDPVTGRDNYLGGHVALAARIEPVTPPGEVYGSGAFAALARATQVRDFECTYVGQTPLAKGYGTFPMYVVQRRH